MLLFAYLPPHGFRPEGENPRRDPSSSRLYIETYLQVDYTVSMPEKNLDLLGAAWNRWVMITFLLFTPPVGLDKFCRQNFEQNRRFLRRAFCWQNKAFSSTFEHNRGKSAALMICIKFKTK